MSDRRFLRLPKMPNGILNALCDENLPDLGELEKRAMTDDAERKRAACDLATSFDAPWLWPKIDAFAREREALAEKRGAIEALEQAQGLDNEIWLDHLKNCSYCTSVDPGSGFDELCRPRIEHFCEALKKYSAKIRALLEARRKA